MADTGDRPVVLHALDLHAQAEEGIAQALTATRAAQAAAADLATPIRDSYEYGEAIRNLLAALTALRSAQMDLEAALGDGQSAAAG
jgi:hypothetical protein